MRCHSVQIHGIRDPDELSPRLRRRMEKHLALCPQCREAIDQSRRVAALVALKRYEQPDPALMDSFVDRFHRRLRLERTIDVPALASRRRWLWAEPAVVFRTALATALVTLAVARIAWVGIVPVGNPMLADDPAADGFGLAGLSTAWVGAGSSPTSRPPVRLLIIRPQRELGSWILTAPPGMARGSVPGVLHVPRGESLPAGNGPQVVHASFEF